MKLWFLKEAILTQTCDRIGSLNCYISKYFDMIRTMTIFVGILHRTEKNFDMESLSDLHQTICPLGMS